jgi:hypothetical protein
MFERDKICASHLVDGNQNWWPTSPWYFAAKALLPVRLGQERTQTPRHLWWGRGRGRPDHLPVILSWAPPPALSTVGPCNLSYGCKLPTIFLTLLLIRINRWTGSIRFYYNRADYWIILLPPIPNYNFSWLFFSRPIAFFMRLDI